MVTEFITSVLHVLHDYDCVIIYLINFQVLEANLLYLYNMQHTLANPNRGVPIQKISVPITEFVRISEVALIIRTTENQ